MVSNNVFSFLKGNVGEEDVIKLLLLSAVKALISVAIFIGGLMSYVKLCEWYGFEFITLAIIMITFFSMWYCSVFGVNTMLNGVDSYNWFYFRDYKTWASVFTHIHWKDMLYIDGNKIIYGDGFFPTSVYVLSIVISICCTFFAFATGVFIITVYAVLTSLDIYIGFPIEAFLTISYLLLSTIFMSALFLKLKWKKIKLDDGYNWNLAAWCVCAAIMITTLTLIAGVAIRRIAGFIGIEYTAILISSYVAMTAIYVYIDLRQWMDRKEAQRIKEEEKKKKMDEAASCLASWKETMDESIPNP